MQPPPPAFPAPPPPPGGYGCPRCGSPHTSDTDMGPRMVMLNHSACNSCGFTFDGKTGKSNVGRVIGMVALPVLVALVLFGLFISWTLK